MNKLIYLSRNFELVMLGLIMKNLTNNIEENDLWIQMH